MTKMTLSQEDWGWGKGSWMKQQDENWKNKISSVGETCKAILYPTTPSLIQGTFLDTATFSVEGAAISASVVLYSTTGNANGNYSNTPPQKQQQQQQPIPTRITHCCPTNLFQHHQQKLQQKK